MARWSEPSYSQGTQRFRVWPLSTDKYQHTELAANWDKVDAIFGTPPVGEWPAGGIFAEVDKIKKEAIPLGMLFPWFRPSTSVPIPAGYVVADGSTLTPAQHSFPTNQNVTIPDLRNRFVLGADINKLIGEAAASVDNPAASMPEGAPGPQAQGGSNAVALTVRNLPKHTHSGGWSGWSPPIMTWYFQESTFEQQKNSNHPEKTAPWYPKEGNFESLRWGSGVHYSAGSGGWVIAQHRHRISSISSFGSGEVHENRPRYVGLIWLIKVKN